MSFDELRGRDFSDVVAGIGNEIRNCGGHPNENVYYLAFLQLQRAERFNSSSFSEILSLMRMRKELEPFVSEALGEALEASGITDENFDWLDPLDVKAYLLFGQAGHDAYKPEEITPAGLACLAAQILDIQPGENVAEFGCAQGTFLVEAAQSCPDASISGMDMRDLNVIISKLRLFVAGIDADNVEVASMFEDRFANGRYDKVFSNYPWGMSFLRYREESDWFARARAGLPEYGRPVNFDWTFNRLLVDSLNAGGRAVGIMTNSAAANSGDVEVRRYFIEQGWIESVVALPVNLVPHSSTGSCLVVFSQNNSQIAFVDATEICRKGRRINVIHRADAEVIARFVLAARNGQDCNEGGGRMRVVSTHDVMENKCKLAPQLYTRERLSFENPVSLGSWIAGIRRGPGLSASELDKLATPESTGLHYLSSKRIEDGLVSASLPCLKPGDGELAERALENGDVLISRYAPFRVAVFEAEPGHKVLPSANLFVLKLSENAPSPYYLAAFLNSNLGGEVLQRAALGSRSPSLSVQALRELVVPDTDPISAEELAQAYCSALEAVKEARAALQSARSKLQDVFDGPSDASF